MPGGATWLALLRGVMPATHAKMSMADLRAACAASGLQDPRTYIASGNLLFHSDRDEAALASLLQDILAGFGLENPVFLRGPAELDATIVSCPFPNAATTRAAKLHVSFMNAAPAPDRLTGLVPMGAPERVALAGRALFIDYAEGAGRSKLTAARIERHLGQPGTARNWNTVMKLRALMA